MILMRTYRKRMFKCVYDIISKKLLLFDLCTIIVSLENTYFAISFRLYETVQNSC